jgi:cytochrome c
MKKEKIIFLFFAISILIIACHKKAVPTFTTRSIDITQTAPVNDKIPDLESGKSIFMSHCNRCHALPDPVKYTTKQFDGILPIMIPRARLNKDEATDVTAYLKANCAK